MTTSCAERLSLLKQHAIFIAEDEPFIALDIACAVEDANGRVVGPAGSVEEALELLETCSVAGAIVDVSLSDGAITPVVAMLVERGVPIVLQSGVGLPAELSARFPHLTVNIKPCTTTRLIDELVRMMSQASSPLE